MSNPPPTLHLLCGKIAAGKSTLAKRLAARPATVLISEDHWNSTLFPDEIKTIEDYSRYSSRVRAALGPHVVSLLKAGLSVVLDFQANTLAVRGWMRTLIDGANAAHELHFLDVPDEICRRRLSERNLKGEHPYQASAADYDLFTRYFVPPSANEGFNVVVHKE
jgi:predicted kinase